MAVKGIMQLRYQSSMDNPPKEALESIFESIEQQAMEEERIRAINKPTPWFSLLHYPSRAAWRASDHLLGNKVNKQTDDDSDYDAVNNNNNNGKSPLEQTQFNLLRQSERTNKQLRRTYKRISETQKQLAIKRERERRMAAKLAGPSQQTKIEQEPDGYIEDHKGREVGSWHERKSNIIPTYYGCDDPSVLLSLSVGMAKPDSKFAKFAKLSSTNMKENSVGYGSEQSMTNLRYRFEPQYAIARRVLLEVQSLLGGTPIDADAKKKTFQPKRVLDFGSGVASSSAAALDVFGVKRSGSEDNSATEGIEWIHSIDASKSMREVTEKVLKSVLERHPWEHEKHADDDVMEEDIAASERILRQIKGDADERGAERRRRRQAKWEQNWTKQSNYRTRLTFGESIVDASSFHSNKLDKDDRPSLPWQRELDEQRQRASQKKAQSSQKGSFDLILCNYTLSEMSNVPSILTAAALLWEKLAPNGVMVLVEPGTPDGFSTLRSVRSMLLECCPPRELKERRKQAEKHLADDDKVTAVDDWEEECHVIAPCTHNQTCPMSRHQRDHIKRNTRFGKYKNIESTEDETNNDGVSAPNLLGGDSDNALTESGTSQSEQEAALRELLGDGNDISEEDLQSMLEIIESMQDGEDLLDEGDDGEDLSDEDDGDESDEDDFDDFDDFYDIDEVPSNKSTSAQTNVFDTSFCSFVHNFPGGTSRKRGEKFSYLVVQKRTADLTGEVDAKQHEDDDLKHVDIVDLLAQSVHHALKHKQEYLKKRVSRDFDDSDTESSYHEDRSLQILQQAVDLEDKFLDSANDDLGLELLHGDKRRKGWGRLIRAPLKRKGHILLDYCAAGGCGESCTKNSNVNDGRGRIIRQKVSRGWSARVAPGCYGAARKARWGGMWPDLSERTKVVAEKESIKGWDETKKIHF
jgi:ribosomal protein RSM22 (predicted rRNA methylase)